MIKKLIGKRALPIILAFTVAVTVMPTRPVFAQEEAPVILEEENIATEPEAEVLQIEDEEEPTAPDTETIELNEAQTGDALYGGEVVCRDITAQVTNDAVEDSIHTLTIHIASTNSENSVSTKGYSWVLYSPSGKGFARDSMSVISKAWDYAHADTADLTTDGDDITLSYKDDGTTDYQLTCIYMTKQGAQLSRVLYTSDNFNSILENGKLSFDVITTSGSENASGIHVFTLRSNYFTGTDSVVLHTDPLASGAAGKYEISIESGDEMPRAVEVGLYHVFWGKDGRVQLDGYAEGEADVVASYNADDKMLEYSQLTGDYAYRETRLYKKNDVDHIRLFALEDNTSAPLQSALERPEFIYVSEASVGTPGQKGYAVVDIDGTGTEGEVSLSTPNSVTYAAVDGARAIRVVSAKIDNGKGELTGVAELRIKYQSDDETSDIFYGRLLPGYYNTETGEWETVPYFIDEENHEVVIFAEHFSIFGLFDVDCSGTRMAFAKEVDAARLAQMHIKTAEAILDPYEKHMLPDPASEDMIGRTLAELDGWANGKTAFGFATFETIQSKIRGLETGKFGTTMTVIGIVGAALCVANRAYHYGWKDEETVKAVLYLGANCTAAGMKNIQTPVALAAVVANAYGFYRQWEVEKQQLVHNDQIDRIYTKWEQKQSWGKWKQKDWAKNVLDKTYEKYFINGTGLPLENYQNYMSHVDTVISGYTHQFASAYQTGDLERMFPGEMPKETEPEGNKNYISDLCEYQKNNLLLYLEPYFRAQSREAYCRAINSLDDYCDVFREEMNKTITVHFQEEVGEEAEPRTKGCSIRIKRAQNMFDSEVTMDQDDWLEAFDENGAATVSFTGAAWAQMGCSRFFQVVDSAGKVIGVVDLPDDFDMGENTYDVSFDASKFASRINIYEVRADAHDDYKYAGCQIRLGEVKLTGPGEDDVVDSLDDEGRALVYYKPDMYRALGSPDKLEILKNGKVIKTVPFDESVTEVKLNSADLIVNISCDNEAAVKHFKDGVAELRIRTRNGRQIYHKQVDINRNGTAVIAVDYQKFDYYGTDSIHELLVMGGVEATNHKRQGRRTVTPEYRSLVMFDADGVSNVTLQYTPINVEDPDYEPLLLDEEVVNIVIGAGGTGQAPIRVLSGKVGSIHSADSKIATATSSIIVGKAPGTTTITFEDEGNPEHKVKVVVVVTEMIPDTFGIYSCVETYSEQLDLLSGTFESKNVPSDEAYVYAVNLRGNLGLEGGRVVGIQLFYPTSYSEEEHPTQFGWSHYEYAMTEYSQTETAEALDYSMYHYNYETVEYIDEDGNLSYTQVRVYDDHNVINADPGGMWFELTETYQTQPAGYTEPMIFGTTRYLFTRTIYKDLETAFANEEYHNFDWQHLGAGTGGVGSNLSGSGNTSAQDSFSELMTLGGTGELTPDENGIYEASVSGTEEGKLYTILVLSGNYDTFPDKTVTELEEDIRYVNVLPAEGDTLTFRFAPMRTGVQTVFVTGEGETPVVAGHINAEEEQYEEGKCKVYFDGAGGSGEMEAVEVDFGSEYELPACAFDAPDGKMFSKWNLGKPGDVITVYEDTVLKAKWTDLKYTVTFNANGGTGIMQTIKVKAGESFKAPNPTTIEKGGAWFLQWNTSSNGTGTAYNPGDEVPVNGDMTLYAIWKATGETTSDEVEEQDRPEDPSYLTKIWVAGIVDKVYTGKALTQEFRVYDGTRRLLSGVDYTVSYKNNTKAYEYGPDDNGYFSEKKAPKVILKMKGNYEGTQTVYFKIIAQDISDDDVFFADDLFVQYNKKKQTPSPALIRDGKKLKAGTDFYVKEYQEEKNNKAAFVGEEHQNTEYTLTLVGKGNFKGERTIRLTIAGGDTAAGGLKVLLMSKVSVTKIPDQDYTGSAITPDSLKDKNGNPLKLEVTYKGKTLTEGTDFDFDLESSEITEAGTATLVLVGKNADESEAGYSFSGSKTVTFKIKGYPMSKVTVAGIGKAYTFDGINPVMPDELGAVSLTYKSSNEIYALKDTDYDVTYRNNDKAGTAEIIFTGKGICTGAKSVKFKILQCSIDEKDGNANSVVVTVTGGADKDNIPCYAKGGAIPSVTVTCNGRKLVEGVDYTLKYKNRDKVYEDESFSTSAPPTVEIKGKGNYKGKRSCFFMIQKKTLSDSEILLVAYDKAESSKPGSYKTKLVATDLSTGKEMKEGKDYRIFGYTYEDGNAVGDSDIIPRGTTILASIEGINNYRGKLGARYLIVNPARDIGKATFAIEKQYYTGNAIIITDFKQATLKTGKTVNPLTLGDDFEIVSYTNNTKVGTAKVLLHGIGSYSGYKTVTFKILKKKTKLWWQGLF